MIDQNKLEAVKDNIFSQIEELFADESKCDTIEDKIKFYKSLQQSIIEQFLVNDFERFINDRFYEFIFQMLIDCIKYQIDTYTLRDDNIKI